MTQLPGDRLALLLASAVALGLVGGCGKEPAASPTAPAPPIAAIPGAESGPNATPSPSPVPPSAKGPASAGGQAAEPASPALAVTADQLARDFQADEKSARAKYQGRWLVINGVYKEAYERNLGGTVSRMFYFTDYNDPGTKHTCAVGCKVDAAHWPKLDGLTQGQKVKVRARCTGGGYQSVALADGELLEAGPDPAVAVPAAQLARDFAANKDATRARYNDRWLLVEGTVSQASTKDRPSITLEGTDDKGGKPVRVEARFRADRESDPGKVKKGDKVKITGKALLYLEDGTAVLDDCKLVR
jgi:hypothetical protein